MAYPNNFYNQNPYNYMYQPQQMIQPQMVQPQMQQPINNYKPQNGLQGKYIDSVDVVKATDIPLDGTISYFPLADGTSIVTKQLMQDGTSKTTVYKPVDLKEETTKQPKYVTLDELELKIKDINNNNVKDDIKAIKKQIRDILKEIEDIKEERKD